LIVCQRDFIFEAGPDKLEAIEKDFAEAQGDYLALPVGTKLTILTCFINRILRSNAIKNIMDECMLESQELNKEKRELERDVKKMYT